MVDDTRGGPAGLRAGDRAGAEHLYRSLVECVPSLVLLLDLDGTIQYANRPNPAAATEFVGSSAFSHLADESERPLRAAMAQVLETAKPTTLEVRAVGIDGAPAWREVHLGPVADDEGSIRAFALIFDDIADQRRATKVLARSDAANRALIEAIPDLIFRISADGRYLSFAPAPNFPLAGDPEEFLGGPLESVLPADVAEVARRAVVQALASSQAQTFEYELIVAGVWGTYEARLVPIEGGDEVVAIVRDITERQAAVGALRESEERFRTSFENAPIGMAIVSLDGVFLEVNRSLCDILGYSESQLVGKGLAAITHPDDLPANLELIRRMVAGEIDSFRMDKRNIHADGHVVWVRLSTALVCDVTGTPLYLISQIEDVTDAVEAKALLVTTAAELERRAVELERSNADLAQFAYAVSHDLSEPLRMISTYLNLFTSRYGGELDEDADEFISVLNESAGRMQVMIRDLLFYSRAGSAETFEPIDLNDVAAEVLANLADRVAATGAEVVLGELPVVVGDRSQLRQVLQNLISNSLKFVEVGVPPRVSVDTERSDDLWRISVRDNGIGIEPRFQARVFIPFRRLHTQDRYPGTGVGLAIAKRIVERHGGTIWMEALPEGGSRFSFTLPAGDHGARS
jgi:PAS domain S-box-containing protein